MSIAAGLLPEGFRDRLPPEAEAAATLLRALLDATASHGYERVQPPLAEFEDGLAGRLAGDSRQQLLRFTDPQSGRTLALRSDITGQVGRIAATRLAPAARPLRLAYGGPVLRVTGGQLAPARELLQMGAELIGLDSVAAVSEILAVALEALARTGLADLTVDLTLPSFVADLAAGPLPLPPDGLAAVQDRLDAKDMAGLHAAGGAAYAPLIAAAGPLDPALAALRALPLTPALAVRLDDVARVAAALPHPVTLDAAERHGFDYQRWIGFTLFAPAVRGEVGRGGAYSIIHPDGRAEPAVGFSLYVDGLVDAGLGRVQNRRVLLPLHTPADTATRLRAEGWATVAALTPAADPAALGCTHVLRGDTPMPLEA